MFKKKVLFKLTVEQKDRHRFIAKQLGFQNDLISETNRASNEIEKLAYFRVSGKRHWQKSWKNLARQLRLTALFRLGSCSSDTAAVCLRHQYLSCFIRVTAEGCRGDSEKSWHFTSDCLGRRPKGTMDG